MTRAINFKQIARIVVEYVCTQAEVKPPGMPAQYSDIDANRAIFIAISTFFTPMQVKRFGNMIAIGSKIAVTIAAIETIPLGGLGAGIAGIVESVLIDCLTGGCRLNNASSGAGVGQYNGGRAGISSSCSLCLCGGRSCDMGLRSSSQIGCRRRFQCRSRSGVCSARRLTSLVPGRWSGSPVHIQHVDAGNDDQK